MSFSKDAIGFYLQCEDQLTPALAAAGKSYSKFIKQIDTSNTTAFNHLKKGMDALSSLVSAFDDLPEMASSQYTKAYSAITKKMKPIVQTVEMKFSSKSQSKAASVFMDELKAAISGIQIKLTPHKPSTSVAGFDHSQSLQSQYKHMAQPPDYFGGLQMPSYKKGTLAVPGPKGAPVIATIHGGEAVVPADIVEGMARAAAWLTGKDELVTAKGITDNIQERGKGTKGMKTEISKLPGEVLSSIAKAQTMQNALSKMQEAIDAGMGPSVMKDYSVTLKSLEKQMGILDKTTKKYSGESLKLLIPELGQVRKQFKELTPELGPIASFLSKSMDPLKFLALNKALENVKESFGGFKERGKDALDKVGAGAEHFSSWADDLTKLNKNMQMSRSDMYAYGTEVAKVADSIDGGAVSSKELLESMILLRNENVYSKEDLPQVAKVVALFAKATNASAESLAKFVGANQNVFSMSKEQSADVLDLQRQLLQVGGSMESMTAATHEATIAGATWLKKMNDPTAVKQIEDNISRVVAATEGANMGSFGVDLMKKSMAAMNGDMAAGNSMRSIGFNALDHSKGEHDLGETLKNDPSKIIDAMHRALGNGSETTITQLQKEGFAIDANEVALAALTSGYDDFTKKMMAAKAPQAEMGKGFQNTTLIAKEFDTFIGRMSIQITNFLQSSPGFTKLNEIFKELNPSLILSIGYLAMAGKELVSTMIPSVWKTVTAMTSYVASWVSAGLSATASAIKQVWAWASIGSAATASAALTDTAAGSMVIASGELATAEGIAAPATTTFFEALAAGSEAIPIILAIGGALVGLGVAMWGVGKAIEATAPIVISLFDHLFAADPKQVFQLGGAMIPFGVGLTAMGVGLQFFGAGALIAAPGLAALAGVLALFKSSVSEAGISGFLSNLMGFFKVDSGVMSGLLRTVESALGFLTRIGNMSVDFSKSVVKFAGKNVLDPVLKFLDNFSPFMSKLGNGISDIAKSVGKFASDNVIPSLLEFLGKLPGFFMKAVSFIEGIVSSVSGFVGKNIIQPVLDFFSSLPDFFSRLFTTIGTIAESVGSFVKTNVFDPIIDHLVSFTKGIYNFATAAIDLGGAIVGNSPTAFINAFKSVTDSVVKLIALNPFPTVTPANIDTVSTQKGEDDAHLRAQQRSNELLEAILAKIDGLGSSKISTVPGNNVIRKSAFPLAQAATGHF